MKQILMYLLLLPLTYSISPPDSIQSSNKNDAFTKVVGGLGFGRYMVCGKLNTYQDAGLSILEYENNGLTYGGGVNFIVRHEHNDTDISGAVRLNIGYSSKYFEILGGLGYPALLNGSLRIGSKMLNLNAQIFNDYTLFSGRGSISTGIGITSFFETGISLGPPSGYYAAGIIPVNNENSVRITFRFNPDNYEEYGISLSLIYFYF